MKRIPIEEQIPESTKRKRKVSIKRQVKEYNKEEIEQLTQEIFFEQEQLKHKKEILKKNIGKLPFSKPEKPIIMFSDFKTIIKHKERYRKYTLRFIDFKNTKTFNLIAAKGRDKGKVKCYWEFDCITLHNIPEQHLYKGDELFLHLPYDSFYHGLSYRLRDLGLHIGLIVKRDLKLDITITRTKYKLEIIKVKLV